jgi:hypothetical protein
MMEAAKDQITIKQGVQNLNLSQRKDIGAGLGALAAKPDLSRNDVLDWASQYVQQNPNAAPLVLTALKHMPDDTNGIRQWAITGRNGVLDPSQQGVDNNVINSGGQTQIVQTNRFQPGSVETAGAPIQNTISPAQAEEIQTDALGNRYIVQRGPNGAILNTRPVPGSYNAANQAPGSGPATLPPGGPDAIKAVQSEVDAARATANQAPVQHDINRTILSLTDKDFATGGLGALTQKFGSALGFKASGDAATDYNLLGKMLERQALSAAQGMGPQTNAGLEAQIKANGSLEYTPQALRQIAELNDAITTGAEHYRNGLENAINQAGGNPMVKRQFDQAWSANFDPTITKLQNAKARGDQASVDAILRGLGGPDSPQTKALLQKARNLSLLESQGHL